MAAARQYTIKHQRHRRHTATNCSRWVTLANGPLPLLQRKRQQQQRPSDRQAGKRKTEKLRDEKHDGGKNVAAASVCSSLGLFFCKLKATPAQTGHRCVDSNPRSSNVYIYYTNSSSGQEMKSIASCYNTNGRSYCKCGPMKPLANHTQNYRAAPEILNLEDACLKT